MNLDLVHEKRKALLVWWLLSIDCLENEKLFLVISGVFHLGLCPDTKGIVHWGHVASG